MTLLPREAKAILNTSGVSKHMRESSRRTLGGGRIDDFSIPLSSQRDSVEGGNMNKSGYSILACLTLCCMVGLCAPLRPCRSLWLEDSGTAQRSMVPKGLPSQALPQPWEAQNGIRPHSLWQNRVVSTGSALELCTVLVKPDTGQIPRAPSPGLPEDRASGADPTRQFQAMAFPP